MHLVHITFDVLVTSAKQSDKQINSTDIISNFQKIKFSTKIKGLLSIAVNMIINVSVLDLS